MNAVTFMKNAQERIGVPTMPELALWIVLKAGCDHLDNFVQCPKNAGLDLSAATAGVASDEGNERQMQYSGRPRHEGSLPPEEIFAQEGTECVGAVT